MSEEDKRSLMHDFTPTKMGKRDELLGVAPSGDDVTLRPQKASKGGREDVRMQQQASSGTDQPGIQEPGIYVLDRVPEAEKRSDLNEPLNANYGRRWIDFQQKLREGRDKVVSDCPLCGTQDKAA